MSAPSPRRAPRRRGEGMPGLAAGGRPLRYTAGLMEEQAVELFRAFYVRGNPKGARGRAVRRRQRLQRWGGAMGGAC